MALAYPGREGVTTFRDDRGGGIAVAGGHSCAGPELPSFFFTRD